MTTATAPAFRRALDPAPSAVERGPLARLHWRAGLGVDPALSAVVVDGAMGAEWPALIAETHARLLDPAGLRPLATPSPIGRHVGAALEATPAWQTLCDAAALHPGIARETTAALASVVRTAVVAAGAAKTDARATAGDLSTARARLAAARSAVDATRKAGAKPTAANLAEAVAAATAEERAAGAVVAAEAAGERAGVSVASQAAAVAAIASQAGEAADGVRALIACGMGDAIGAATAGEVPDDVVRALTPDVVKLMKLIGALRESLREGRASRHLPGREGVLGQSVGGLADVGDLTALSRAALSGALGAGMASLARLQLVQGRAATLEKGGGHANKGDVVVVLDQSGSMAGARALWANALALAVVLEAQSAGRHAAVVTFDGAVRTTAIADGPTGTRAALRACLGAPDGGTNLRAALTAARDTLALMRRSGAPADVLLITDGDWTADALTGWPSTTPLRAVFVGGDAPAEARFTSSWSVNAVDGADGQASAVEIARTIV